MAEVVCDTKSFTITLEPAVSFTWSIIKKPASLPPGENGEVIIRYNNRNTFEHEVCVMLMDGTSIVDASPEACREGVLLGHDIAGNTSKDITVWAKNMPNKSWALTVKVCGRKSLI